MKLINNDIILNYIKSINLDQILLGIILFTLPISIKLNSISIIVASLYFFYKIIKNNSWNHIKYFFPSIVFFLVQLLSLMISKDFNTAIKKLVLFLPFLLFPFFFTSVLTSKSKVNNKLFTFLAAGVICIITYGFFMFFFDILIYDVRYDYGYGIDLFLNYTPHHVYLSIYVLISICLFFNFLKDRRSKVFILLIAYLYLVIVFLSSRTALFVTLILTPFFLYIGYGKRYSFYKLFFLLCLVFVFISAIIVSLDYTKDKIIYFFYEIFNINVDSKPFLGVSDRAQIWNTCFELIKQLPFFGYGIGDIQFFLNSMYIKKGYYNVVNMNTHNQYLQFYLTYGLMQTLLLLYLIYKLILESFKLKKYFIVYSWLIILFFCFTESILNRQWGVVIFAFVLNYSLYLLNKPKKIS